MLLVKNGRVLDPATKTDKLATAPAPTRTADLLKADIE